jgi:hypothetical protein
VPGMYIKPSGWTTPYQHYPYYRSDNQELEIGPKPGAKLPTQVLRPTKLDSVVSTAAD